VIPERYIEECLEHTPWQFLPMVEQDMVISRALIELYSSSNIKEKLVFRGGTALNKLFMNPAARYSEDIDLVQIQSEPIGDIIDCIRDILKPWLGEPKRKLTERSAKLIYSYTAVGGLPAKLKIEINTTEHIKVLPLQSIHFSLNSNWFSGSCEISVYVIEELLATKLRALYQRRKGRDLFDLWYILKDSSISIEKIIEIFNVYCRINNTSISRDMFLENLNQKRQHQDFLNDMNVLLPKHVQWNFEVAYSFVITNIINKLTY
jgi:predicted nucleotidyltransferase component of viral defense system